MNWREKLEYFKMHMLADLKDAFKRGDAKYVGANHHTHSRYMDRTAVHDINHIRSLHVDVRLREAEEAADNGDLPVAMRKIVSAIGYLIILHIRLAKRM